MTPIEDAVRRSIAGHVISIADWQRALLFLGDRGNAPHGDESFANYQFSGAMNEAIWDIPGAFEWIGRTEVCALHTRSIRFR